MSGGASALSAGPLAMDQAQVSGQAVAKVVLIVAGVVGGLYFAYLIREVVGLFLIAAFFAVAIAPAVNWLDRAPRSPLGRDPARLPRRSAASIFGIGLLIVPPLVNGVTDLSNDLPGYVDDLRHNQTFRDYDNRYHITEKLTRAGAAAPDQARRRRRHAARRHRRASSTASCSCSRSS